MSQKKAVKQTPEYVPEFGPVSKGPVIGVIVPDDERHIKARARAKKWRENPENREKEKARKSTPEYLQQRRDYKKRKPHKVRLSEKQRSFRKTHRPIVAHDTEGMKLPGQDVVVRKQLEDHTGILVTVEDIYPEHRTILVGSLGWARKHSPSALAADLAFSRMTGIDPDLSRTDGTVIGNYWLGDDTCAR